MLRVLFVLLALAAPAAAQVSGPPHVFVVDTVANPDEVNLNFSTIYSAACNRNGCTMLGNLLFSPDNTIDIGASGANRPRDLFLGRNAAIGGTLGVTGATTLAALSATTGTFSSTLGVTGNTTVGGTLGVTGASTIAALSATSGTFSSTLGVTGNTTIGGTLGVTGASTLAALSATTGNFSGLLTLGAGASVTGTVTATTLAAVGAVTGGSASFTTATVGTLTGAGAVLFTSAITPPALSANVDDYNPTGFSTAYLVRVQASGADRNVTGLVGGVAGRIVVFCNVGGSFNVVFPADTTSTAANRFAAGFSFLAAPGTCVSFIYDGTSTRWRGFSHIH